MKKIFVIGKNGYVASAFREYMGRYEGYVITSASSRNHEWEQCNFTGYDVVFNASGLSHSNARKGTEEQFYEVNGRLPVEIARKTKEEGVPLYISISSSIVYGDMSILGEEKLITRDTIPTVPTIYGKSKLMAEQGLKELESDDFQIAILRPPLIYGERQTDNFPRLVWFAMHLPIFPNVPNRQSMIYIDNFCELLKLIIDSGSGGLFFPQERKYIETAKLVKDISVIAGNHLWLTRMFNPILKLMQKKVGFIHKVLGNFAFDTGMSSHFEWRYCKVGYEEGLKRIVEYKKEQARGQK